MEANKNFLVKIRSKYVLEQVFENLHEKKLLEIIRYNKNLQKKFNKGLKDYMKIEIEIIPEENIYSKFICIPNKYKSYYHIYFNDNKKEIKAKKINNFKKVSKINVILDSKIESLHKLFNKCKSVKKIRFIKFNRRDITDMSYMFNECSSLIELDLYKFHTDNVITMNNMFSGCKSLK